MSERSNKHIQIEEVPYISIQDLNGIGIVKNDGFYRLRNGIGIERFLPHDEDEALPYIEQPFRRAGDISFYWKNEKGFFMEHVAVAKMSVHYGGFRYYFVCPYCHRRLKKLYFGTCEIACRHCFNLVYQRCQENKSLFMNLTSAEIYRVKAEHLRINRHPRLARAYESKAEKYDELFWTEAAKDIKKTYRETLYMKMIDSLEKELNEFKEGIDGS